MVVVVLGFTDLIALDQWEVHINKTRRCERKSEPLLRLCMVNLMIGLLICICEELKW